MNRKAELIFHPLRMRILQVLLRRGQLTPNEIGEALTDVAPATLYRHLKHLLNGGVVEVVEERPIRGVVERVYAVNAGGASLTPDEVRAAPPDEYVRYLAVFLIGLMEQFEAYAKGPDPDLVRDGVGFRQAAVYATDNEFQKLLNEIKRVIDKAGKVPRRKGRKRRLLAGVAMPVADESSTPD